MTAATRCKSLWAWLNNSKSKYWLKIDKNDIKATLATKTFKEKALKIPEKEINPSLLRIKLKIITLTIAEIELAIAKPRCPKPK